MVFYNALLAFVLMAICYAVGEWIATATKAWVPSVFASAILYLFGYWTFFPKTIGTDSGLVPFAATVAMMLLIVHIGTIIRYNVFPIFVPYFRNIQLGMLIAQQLAHTV